MRLRPRLPRPLAGLLSRGHTRPAPPDPSSAPPADGPPAGWTYAPEADGEPDPGEVVWAWVPYDDDPRQGKDRPVLLLEQRGDTWLGLMLSSQDHDRDAEDEARWGRHWMDVGSGAWDASGRPSEVRLDRLVPLRRDAIRREGAALDETLFTSVVTAARGHHPLGGDH